MTSVYRKTLKTLVASDQRKADSEIALKITTKLAVFYRLLFGEVLIAPKTPPKLPQNRPIFPRICP